MICHSSPLPTRHSEVSSPFLPIFRCPKTPFERLIPGSLVSRAWSSVRPGRGNQSNTGLFCQGDTMTGSESGPGVGLPTEILLKIMLYLGLIDILTLRQVRIGQQPSYC